MAKKAKQAATPTYLDLDQEQAAVFDRYLSSQEKERAQKRTAAVHEKDRKDAQRELDAIFGTAKVAQLPDGRIVHRNVDDRHRKAQPASDFQIIEYVTEAA